MSTTAVQNLCMSSRAAERSSCNVMTGQSKDLTPARVAVSSHNSTRPDDLISDWEIDEMISRCLFVLDLKQKCFGTRFTPWPSVTGSPMSKEEVRRRVATSELDIPNEELDRLIREILSRDDAVTSFHRAVQLMTAAFWDVHRIRGYLPWTMTAPPFAYQVKKYGHPLNHYIRFYRIFMNIIGFEDEKAFDMTGIPKKISNYAKYRNAQALRGSVLSKSKADSFSPYEILAMKTRCHALLRQEPEPIVIRKIDNLWPDYISWEGLEERILSLRNPFADDHLHEMLMELLLKPSSLTSMQRAVRHVFEVFWSSQQIYECYLPSTCNGVIRESQQGRKPLPHHETFYSIFMQLLGFPDAESFNGSPEAVRIFKFALHLKQWERESRVRCQSNVS